MDEQINRRNMVYFFAFSLAGVSLGVVLAEPIDVEVSDNLQLTVHSREDDLMPFPH